MKRKLVAVAVAALVPVVALLAYSEVATRYQRNQEVRAAAAQAARQAASEVERIIEGLHSLLIALSSMPAIQNLDASLCSESLTAVASKVPNIRTIFVVNPQGQSVCASMPTSELDFADRNYFRRAMETKDFVVGTYTNSRISDASILPIALPVMEGDVVKAVVVTGVRLDWLQMRITERGSGTIKTLNLNVKATIRAVESTSEKGPDYRILAGATVEFGAAWKKTSNEGRDYLSVKLDHPSFPAPIYATLIEVEGEEGLSLIWSRSNRD